MKIRIVSPVVPKIIVGESDIDREKRLSERANERRKLFQVSPSTEIEFVSIEKGPTSVECRYDEMLAVPQIVKRSRKQKRMVVMQPS